MERRRASRWVPGSSDPVSRLRLRLGRDLAVVNVSAGGALVQGPARLLPGTHVDVHVTASQGRLLIRARVMRCAVWDVTADTVQYRGALAFTTPVDLQPIDGALLPMLTDPPADAMLQPLPEPV
jgi:hypothetical protein